MRLPRDLSGQDMIKRLERLDYQPTRQTGSHIRLTKNRDGQHHVTTPNMTQCGWYPLIDSQLCRCTSGSITYELLERLEGKCSRL